MASSSGSTQNIYDGNPQQRKNENNENTGNKPSNTIVKDEPGDNTQKIAANKQTLVKLERKMLMLQGMKLYLSQAER
ncbi:hypothetical protein DPMN_166757 [Dreissena polymorpha]|uniref:Uncharacterized protein n=1 Tax=Dreissena polymorpha TaxID=45954 RepID=A0A9D4EZG8_DREPO|nr:hypothetical protein DPMN_166757 [Dreissena polymorpha]